MDATTRKHRSLRRYEADTTDYESAPANGRLAVFSPFGPLIGRCAVDMALLYQMNLFGDVTIDADRGTEFIVPNAIATQATAAGQSLLGMLTDAIKQYVVASEGFMPSVITIDRIWMVSQYAGTASPVHFHSGDLSGVLYLKMPAHSSTSEFLEQTYIAGRQAGFINFMIGGRQDFSKSIVSFPPDVGTFYIFPAWLLHGAEPFVGPGERRSLSFNARVEVDD